ncbi:CBS domain-containing protein [Nocardioides iriomotensis]|uniref:CBS domain-containing protein n=1 Tax=Nocardioides iriomotensis TaxID=715784 RepID=A0A4Q5IXP0_9ACTN|nr:CBS domain-containing protein [Nocardioides iriomotensis]RYU09988.1 CBS domain-containing protein [Nocardioides iriomotensis]
MRIHEVLSGKGSQDVVTIKPDATVRELIALLAKHNIGALVVSTDGSTVDGIVSERDVVRRLHELEAVVDLPVSDIMTADVQTCTGDASVHELMKVMTERRFRHLPVVADGRLTGIVSIGDVVKHRMSELEFERDQLDHYVHGA